jgi:hypothetical protein
MWLQNQMCHSSLQGKEQSSANKTLFETDYATLISKKELEVLLSTHPVTG